MQTDGPTVELFFVFALTYCKLRVYEEQEIFARKILEALEVEFCKGDENGTWELLDTRILLDLVSQTLPKMILAALPKPASTVKSVTTALGIKE